jgi:hypothetical protein
MSRLSLGKVTVNDLANRAPGDTSAPILTSPRSLRVCLERGVEPGMLVPRLPESFAKPELSAEHVQVKWERHERTRLQRVVALNKARDALPEAPDEDAPRVPGVAGAGLMTSGPLSSGASPGPSLVPVSPARTTPSLFGDVVTPQHSMSSPYATPKRRAALLRPTSAPVRAARGDGAVISAVREDARRLEAARRRTENQLAVIVAAKRRELVRRATAEAKLAREERKAEEREAERAKKELKRIEKALKKQRDRDKRYDDAKRMERSRSASIMLKHEEEDVRLARAEEERRKELEMQTLKKRLTLEEKMENVEMTERRRQYEAALLLEKIERDTARAKAVNAAREELAQQRRLENYELSLERELLLHADAPEIRRVSSIKAKHRPVSARPLGTRWR